MSYAWAGAKKNGRAAKRWLGWFIRDVTNMGSKWRKVSTAYSPAAKRLIKKARTRKERYSAPSSSG